MDCDGTKAGYDLELTAAVSERVGIPVIASGGAGCHGAFCRGPAAGEGDAVLAASLFHYHEVDIGTLKTYPAARGTRFVQW